MHKMSLVGSEGRLLAKLSRSNGVKRNRCRFQGIEVGNNTIEVKGKIKIATSRRSSFFGVKNWSREFK